MPLDIPSQAKATVVIPVYPGVDLLDVAGPFEMFYWTQALAVQVVAQHKGLITCGSGLTLYVDRTFAEAEPDAALWTPGGDPAALVAIMDDPKRTYLRFLQHQARQAPIVASVCEGALLLAAAGLLDGYSATTHWAFVPCLKDRFPKVKVVDDHPRFVRNRNRLTGAGISSGLDEALELVTILLGQAAAEDVQQTTEYFPAPPPSKPRSQRRVLVLSKVYNRARTMVSVAGLALHRIDLRSNSTLIMTEKQTAAPACLKVPESR
jgi:transcriptional regulator GlxA family with amidase domain